MLRSLLNSFLIWLLKTDGPQLQSKDCRQPQLRRDTAWRFLLCLLKVFRSEMLFL